MDDLIRREDAVDILEEPIVMSMCLTKEECEIRNSMRMVDRKLIEGIPTVDAVEVVRCKDCCRSVRDGRGELFCCHLLLHWNSHEKFYVDEDSFCSWGIRKEK